MNILCDKTFPWVPLYFTLWHRRWSLTLFFENFKLANTFWTVSARALIFHMSIPCDKTFSVLSWFFINIRAFILHMGISCDKIYLLVSRYLSLWPWLSLELAIIRGNCVSQTHLVSGERCGPWASCCKRSLDDMQLKALLSSRCTVSDTQVTVMACEPLTMWIGLSAFKGMCGKKRDYHYYI